MLWDGVCVAGFIEGSGLRSDGGIRSGLEDVDLPVFWVNSTGCMLREPSPVLSNVGFSCELDTGLSEALGGGVFRGEAFGSLG